MLLFGLIITLCLTACTPPRRHSALVRPDTFAGKKIPVATNEDATPSLRQVVLAVLPLKIPVDMSPDGRLLAEAISQQASRNPRIRVVERVRIDAVLQELSFGDGGLVAEQSAVRIGNLLGANMLLLGSAASEGRKNLLTMRLVQVETGEIIGGITLNEAGDLASLAEAAYGQLDAQIAAKPQPAPR